MNPKDCKHYQNGQCDIMTPRHKCCMRVVKPMTECFYFTPKTEKQ
nr:MAG TPA: hypothetical protein [Caudoviricetes sp.]